MKNKIGIFLIILGISVISYGVFLDNSKIDVKKTDSPQTVELSNNIEPVATVKSSMQSSNSNSLNAEKKSNIETFDSNAILRIGTDNFKLEFNAGEALYDALRRLQTRGSVVMKGKEYSGLGFFIEEINNLKPDKGKSLILFINNKKAMVGVSGYKLNNGDLIEFKIEDNY